MVDISRIDMLLGRAFQKHFYKINSISFLHVLINIADKAWKKKKKSMDTRNNISHVEYDSWQGILFVEIFTDFREIHWKIQLYLPC